MQAADFLADNAAFVDFCKMLSRQLFPPHPVYGKHVPPSLTQAAHIALGSLGSNAQDLVDVPQATQAHSIKTQSTVLLRKQTLIQAARAQKHGADKHDDARAESHLETLVREAYGEVCPPPRVVQMHQFARSDMKHRYTCR